MLYNSKKFPDGKLKTIRRGFFDVRPYGGYEVQDYSKDTLVPEKTSDNFDEIRPYMFKFGRKRYYIASAESTAERKTKVKVLNQETGEMEEKEVGEKYNYLPVYSSLNFGSYCIARLCAVEDMAGLYIGTIGGWTVKLDIANKHSYEKKDGNSFDYYVAEVSRMASRY